MSSVALRRAPSVHAIGVAQLVAWGATFYAIPPLLPWISADLEVSMATLSVAISVGLLGNAVLSLGVAAWVGRRGARAPMVTGSVVASFALLVLAASRNELMAVAALALLGAAHAALLYEPAFAAVSAQTADPITRTRAIQVVTFWGGWAALWALPAASLLARSVGWRIALVMLAVLLAVHTVRIHARLLSLPVARKPLAPAPPPPISRQLAVAFGLGAFATTAIVVNGLHLLGERRISVASASLVFALLAPAQIFGRLWFMRRLGRLARHDGSIPFLLVAAGTIALLAAPRVYAMVAFVLLFGAGTGLLTTIRAAAVVARIPPQHVARHLGVYGFVTAIARALAPAVSSWMYLCFGYELTVGALVAMALVAAALVAVTAYAS